MIATEAYLFMKIIVWQERTMRSGDTCCFGARNIERFRAIFAAWLLV